MARESFDSLPPPLDEIAEVAGLEAALAIAEAVGGTRVSIPPRPAAGHWLTELVGEETARLICRHFATLSPEGADRGARHIVMPRGPRALHRQARARFDAARTAGKSIREAARIARVHEQTAFRYERRRKRRSRQGDLFDG